MTFEKSSENVKSVNYYLDPLNHNELIGENGDEILTLLLDDPAITPIDIEFLILHKYFNGESSSHIIDSSYKLDGPYLQLGLLLECIELNLQLARNEPESQYLKNMYDAYEGIGESMGYLPSIRSEYPLIAKIIETTFQAFRREPDRINKILIENAV